ncbi:MAG: FadR/GntR family transcriptional regulator [Chloroflexota bacterium]
MFKSLERTSTLANRVSAEIEAMIVQRHFQSGDRLPSERELSEQFGVSRTVVREAVRALVAKNLLEVRPGSGTVICTPTSENFADAMSLMIQTGLPDLSIEKVIEVRRLLEVTIAGLAAARRTEADLAAMAATFATMEAYTDDRERYSEADLAFHNHLARATQNELFTIILDSVSRIMVTTFKIAFHGPGKPARSVRHHRAVLDRVAAGDVAGARQAMLDHLVEFEQRMRQNLADLATSQPNPAATSLGVAKE